MKYRLGLLTLIILFAGCASRIPRSTGPVAPASDPAAAPRTTDHAAPLCSQCSGLGYIDCPQCQGTGRQDCPTCGGPGHAECGDCRGLGYVRCPACDGTGHVECPGCQGTGRVK